jgi:hypothetical protein
MLPARKAFWSGWPRDFSKFFFRGDESASGGPKHNTALQELFGIELSLMNLRAGIGTARSENDSVMIRL